MLVRDALAYLDRLEQEGTGDVDLQKELALAYLKMGDVQGKMYNANVGDTEGALASYSKSIGLFESVVAKRPEDIDAKDNLIQAYDNLAFLMLRAGGDAKLVVGKALALFETIPAANQQASGRTLKLIDLQIRFGDATGPRTATLAAHERALPLIDQINQGGDADYDTYQITARAFQRIGTDHFWLGLDAETKGDETAAKHHFEQSLAFQQKAFAAVEKLSALAPDKPESQRYLAASYGNLAESLAAAGLTDDALVAAANFMNTVKKTIAADPNNRETQLNLSNANEVFAGIYKRRGDDLMAINYTHKALAIDEAIVNADSKNNEVRGRLAPRHKLLAELYTKLGQSEKAEFHRQKAGS
jgi:tetratricopeptide (TPR) repeat protein